MKDPQGSRDETGHVIIHLLIFDLFWMGFQEVQWKNVYAFDSDSSEFLEFHSFKKQEIPGNMTQEHVQKTFKKHCRAFIPQNCPYPSKLYPFEG